MAQCAVQKNHSLNGHPLLFMFLATPAQPVAHRQCAACNTVLCCLQSHLKWENIFLTLSVAELK